MNTKTAVAILLVAIFALSSIATITIKLANASPGSSSTLTLSDAELMSASFAYEWGPGTLTGRALIAPGVRFDFNGLQPGADTGVGNNFPVNALAGGAYKDYGYGFAGPYDFSGYKRYCLCIENVGTEPATVALMMNTGWTSDWSGGQWVGSDGFGASLARDTFWRSDWVTIGLGECKVVCLDFSSATCYHAMDDPVTAWKHSDGTTGIPVQRLDEVSNIGFMVLGNDLGSIVVKGTQLYVDPPEVHKVPGDVGTTFDTYVKLENFANLAGFDINMTWNGSIITCTSVDHSTTLDALWGVGMWSTPIEQSGVGFYRLVAVALATSASNVGASVLFRMTFHVDTSSTSPLSTPIHFDVASLSDNSVPIPKPIVAEVTDGMYYMSAAPPEVHDVAVLSVVNNCTRGWMYQGYGAVGINVTVQNLGDFAENVNVTVYYNITANQIIGTRMISLSSGASQKLVFEWTTTGVQYCHNYTITAYAAVPLDVNWANNVLADGNVKVRIPGDVNGDGVVNLVDYFTVALAFGESPGRPHWNPDVDINGDLKINLIDVFITALNFGKRC